MEICGGFLRVTTRRNGFSVWRCAQSPLIDNEREQLDLRMDETTSTESVTTATALYDDESIFAKKV